MTTLEQNQKFSESVLWELQDAAYTQFGPEAWAKKGVPFYLTSNPLIARQFSQMIAAFLDESRDLDPLEPIYIFDLGAGSGRLGYLVIKELLSLLDSRHSFVYVMTDMVEENLSFWQQHSLLASYFDQGVLDCALYKHNQDQPLKLVRSNKTLEQTKNPVILICTYYFDTIPQDLFRAQGGVLEEGRVTITLPEGVAKELDPEWIMKLEPSYSYHPISNPENYYPNGSANSILEEYADAFTNTPFLFPNGGIESLEYFRKLSGQRMLLLAGDQGVCTQKQIRESGEPEISRHSSFSIPVNYHVLARYFENYKGLGLHTSFPDPQFVVMAGILGKGEYQRTRTTFYHEIDALESVEYWNLTGLSEEQCAVMTLEQLLILIKLGNFDPLNLHFYFDSIQKKIVSAKHCDIERLKHTIDRCLDNFYPIDPAEGDFLMNMGVLFYELKDYKSAMAVFHRALEVKGIDEQILLNMALCQKELSDR